MKSVKAVPLEAEAKTEADRIAKNWCKWIMKYSEDSGVEYCQGGRGLRGLADGVAW